jgi:hypothetical protein
MRRIRNTGEHLERAGEVDLIEILEQRRPDVEMLSFGKHEILPLRGEPAVATGPRRPRD